ncbi:hypothetical protein HPB47_020278 [Ixodes persulcatus]|uniref:Uncharacterized protein n=1 Tax=Ixodes persulcatus TaxID=34615 RepID=A0AC60QGS9_IXOPE|nr:hypothetical protein HPB47_020278 [Ixodes persulcatus]
MVHCCVPLCTSHGKKGNGISFHEFPSSSLREEWITKISRAGKSVPTVFENYPIHKQCNSKHNRKPPATRLAPAPPPHKRRRYAFIFLLRVTHFAEYLKQLYMTTLGFHLLRTPSPVNERNAALEGPRWSRWTSRYSDYSNSQTATDDDKPKSSRHISVQTNMIGKRIEAYRTKIDTLTRKCKKQQLALKKLRGEVATLKKDKKKTSQLLRENNVTTLLSMTAEGNKRAVFLQQQLKNIRSKKPRWTEETIRYCILWYAKSPSAYRLVRASGLLKLPSRSTLKRYLGACSGAVVTSLIKQRLQKEARIHKCSLALDEMSIRPSTFYQRQADEVHGLVSEECAESGEMEVATHLLCFVFVGLSTHYRLPVGYFFTRALTGTQLHQITMSVLRSIEQAGFVVVRVVADNHATNRKQFSMLSNGSILPVVEHPLDATRWLFLSFDYCHIIKNVRSQFLAKTRRFYLRSILDIQQKQKGFKLVRNMTRKHLYPTSFEKMNVKRAVDIFKPEDSEPTIEFLETFFKWFTLHNIKSTTHHIFSRDANRMPSYSTDDERLSWLEDTFLEYVNSWKRTAPSVSAFLTPETHEALAVTTLQYCLRRVPAPAEVSPTQKRNR